MDSSQQALQINEKLFYKFQICFRNVDRKPKNIQKNSSEAWILIKVKCDIYQWIWLDKLYKLWSFFSNFGIIFRISCNFFKIIVALGLWVISYAFHFHFVSM